MGNSKTIVIISPNMIVDIDYTTKSTSRFVPEGLLYLATPLLVAGYDVRICDMAKDDLNSFEADVFGITGLPNQFNQIKEAIGIIRRNQPDAKIILGGPFVACAIDWFTDLLDFDLAIFGEAESIIASAVNEALKVSGKKIIKAEPLTAITDLYRPAFELIDLEWYLNGWHRIFNYPLARPTINNLMISRGCPKSCNFCRQPFGKKIKLLPHDNIDFILESYAKAGAKSIRFQDDNWQYLPTETRRHVLKKLADLGLQTAFNSRVDDFSSEFLKEVTQHNVIKQISFGVESISQKSLKAMNKGTSADQIRRVIDLCRNYNIEPAFFIMVGAPGETKNSIDTIIRLIENEKVFPLFTFFLPIPSTMYWHDFLKHHSVADAFSMFDGWDKNQIAEKKIYYNITNASDTELIDYYSQLKKLQDKFKKKG